MSTPTHTAITLAAGVLSALALTRPLSAQDAPVRDVLSVESEPLNDLELSYRLQLDGRDTTGHYNWSGLVDGPTRGRAAVWLAFQKGPSPEPGLAPVQTRWVVRASPDRKSFEAALNGTIDMVAGRAHLVGVIIAGAGRGQRIETNSQLFNLGPNAALSESNGTIRIAGSPAGWARADASALPPETTPRSR
jgi:hypothetical protein